MSFATSAAHAGGGWGGNHHRPHHGFSPAPTHFGHDYRGYRQPPCPSRGYPRPGYGYRHPVVSYVPAYYPPRRPHYYRPVRQHYYHPSPLQLNLRF